MLLKVSEASERYGLSGARIRKLINEGRLSAEKRGRNWYVDDNSIARHVYSAMPGRPTVEEERLKKRYHPREYTLMSRNHEVAACVYDPLERCFTRVEVLDDLRVPLRLKSYRVKHLGLRHEFNSWWGNRAIPESRDFIDGRLRELGLASTFEIPLRSMGLSLSDQYWLRPNGSRVTWEEVSYYRNAFELGEVDDKGRPMSSSNEWTNSVGLNSPDNTTDGMLRKRWILDESGRRLLIKGSDMSGREAYNEIIATMLYRRLLPSSRYVEYKLASWRGHDVSVCETFLKDDEEFIPAWDILRLKKKSNEHSQYRHYCERCDELQVHDAYRQLDRMLVCDSILANIDRHWGNFGVIRNIETLEYRAAPIFDTGSSLWTHLSYRELMRGNFAFTTKPFFRDPRRQFECVTDASWYHPEALEGFVDEVRDYLDKLVGDDVSGLICKGLQQRINEVNFAVKKLPSAKCSPEKIGDSETLYWVWI